MPTAVFGLEASDVAARHAGMEISSTSLINTTTVDEMLAEREDEVVGALVGMSYSADTLADTSQRVHNVARGVVLKLVIADVELGAGAIDSETHGGREERAWATIERLRMRPQDAGESRPTGDTAPQIMRTTRALAAERKAARIANGDALGRLLYDP